MPANPKYLTNSLAQRLTRLLAGFLGGYCISTLFHLILATFISKSIVLITFTFSGFILWAVLFIVAYIPKKTVVICLLYFIISTVLASIFFALNANLQMLN